MQIKNFVTKIEPNWALGVKLKKINVDNLGSNEELVKNARRALLDLKRSNSIKPLGLFSTHF